MIQFNIQNENDEIVRLQNKRINNNITQNKHATKLALTKSEHSCTDKRHCDAII